MRCLSPHASYSIQVIEGDENIVVDPRGHATTVVNKKPVIAQFDKTGLLDWEIEAALELMSFSGLPEGINPLTRVGVFDSEAFVQQFKGTERDAMLIQIDQRLRELQPQNPSQFIIVDPPHAARPWPSYDKDSVEDILKIQERLQMHPEPIRLYELENAHRSEIVEAMLDIEDPGRNHEAVEGEVAAVVQA